MTHLYCQLVHLLSIPGPIHNTHKVIVVPLDDIAIGVARLRSAHAGRPTPTAASSGATARAEARCAAPLTTAAGNEGTCWLLVSATET